MLVEVVIETADWLLCEADLEKNNPFTIIDGGKGVLAVIKIA
jgi:hypothetical protein